MKRQDDVGELLKQMQRSRVWVLSTPIYWLGPIVQFKAFIDRWYCSNQMNYARRCAILVIPLGVRAAHFVRHIIGILRDILNFSMIKLMVIVLHLNSYNRGAIHNNTDILAKARYAGREVIEKRKVK
jgi:hypothetical protein